MPGLFRAIQLNICHAQRDTFFSFTFGVSTRLCPLDSPLPPNPSLPGLFRAIQLNICHAQRDSLFSFTFGISTRLCPLNSPLPPNPSLPGLFRAIQWNMSSGVAGLLLSRLRRGNTVLVSRFA
ncbi:hypothetical protein [Candidatus Spongiihabitans sp.]|uniref:hypothetical protein n=1 Tax=Candidatus Spongiihabitans sp. TaxID=3101308 RepID=UPI003C7ABFB8